MSKTDISSRGAGPGGLDGPGEYRVTDGDGRVEDVDGRHPGALLYHGLVTRHDEQRKHHGEHTARHHLATWCKYYASLQNIINWTIRGRI